MRFRLLCVFAFSMCIAPALWAEERIARAIISETNTGLLPMVTIHAGHDFLGVLSQPETQAEINRLTFFVYRKDEIDARQAQDRQDISNLLDTIAVLRQNLKDLADANDALTRRLEQLEQLVDDED